MNQFEFITVAISIVMALGVSRLLDALGPALRPGSRSWIHVGWIAQKFFNHVLWWWTIWYIRDAEWNLGLFVFELVGPVILYLQAAALAAPSEQSPLSWQDRFFEIRVPFFLGNLALVVITLSAPSALFDTAQDVPTAPLVFLGALAIAGLATRNIRAHMLIVAVALGVQFVALGSAVFAIPNS
ncbi:MAG: hypothetical protein JRF61_06550 [Deltaproteobacteria bacterium]|nr:hypothetical protein [Deltaproteobacteria bacterium]